MKSSAESTQRAVRALLPPVTQRPYLGPEVCGGPDVLVLGFGRAPGVVQLEALVAVARPAVHAALGGLLLWRLAHAAHDGHGGASRLAVALHDALQGEVPKQHADAAFAQVDVVLAARARNGGDPRGHRPSAPSLGGDGTWREGGGQVSDHTCEGIDGPPLSQSWLRHKFEATTSFHLE